ncbi:M23 family metallopeptidase [Demequina sediminicola]|uniref:M23 family metallopeptidase n=1 Tax=Demequina sediminicola TaxID=1095026 RepID=UPI000783E416|nr:M23 family metallopeptidase [Demequina sediminicola]
MNIARRQLILIAAVVLAAIVGGIAVGYSTSAGASVSDWEDEVEKQQDALDAAEDKLSDANDQKASAQDQAAILDSAIDTTDEELVAAQERLDDLNAQLAELEIALDEAQAAVDAAVIEQGIVADKLATAEAQDKAITAQIAADEERTAELQELVAAIAYEAYQGTSLNASLSIVLGAANAREFVDEYMAQESASRVQSNTLTELEEIAAVNRNRAVRQEAVRVYIEELKAEADALVIELEGLRQEAADAKAEVEALAIEQAEAKEALEAERARLVAEQKENDALQQQIRNEVQALFAQKSSAADALSEAEQELADAEAEANANNGGGSGGSSGGSSGGGASSSGYFDYPTKNVYITSSYGMRYHPVLGYWRLHAGTDFRAYCGTPIYASAAGTVVWSKYRSGFGNQVLIDHGNVGGDNIMTSSNHLSSFAVSSGQRVSQGTLIGYSGTTGTSTACHLHFEMYVNGPTVNPMSVLN